MDRMVYPVEEPDFETFCYDVETLTRDAVDMVCQLFGFPTFAFPLDAEAIDAALAPLHADDPHLCPGCGRWLPCRHCE